MVKKYNGTLESRKFTSFPIKTLLLSTLLSTMSAAHAIGISDQKYTELAGELSSEEQAVNQVYGTLSEASQATRFDAVGMLLAGNKRCTGTWLGNEGDTAYIITAAHCVEGDNKTQESNYTGERMTFRTGDGRILASGIATAHFTGHTRCANDIAVLEIPLVAEPVNRSGRPIQQPVFADKPEYLGYRTQPMTLAGYGLWGTPTLGNVGWGRASGPGSVPVDFGGCLLNRANSEAAWAFGTPGDSGSASWQWQNGWFVGSGISSAWVNWESLASFHTRVAPHHEWLKRVYPKINTVTRAQTLTESSPVITDSIESNVRGAVYYTAGANVQGPSNGKWVYPNKFTYLAVNLVNQGRGTNQLVLLRAQRRTHCGWGEMNNGVYCQEANKGDLKVWFDPSDNGALPPGLYQGEFAVEAKGWHDASFNTTIELKASIFIENNRFVEGTVTRHQGARTIPYDRKVHGTVYYQAMGSTTSDTGSGVWNALRGWSTLNVPVRNRDTKETHNVKLRASRFTGCFWGTMNNAVLCQGDNSGSYGQLDISFHESDNPDLPDGNYDSYFDIKALGWHRHYVRPLVFRLELNKGE